MPKPSRSLSWQGPAAAKIRRDHGQTDAAARLHGLIDVLDGGGRCRWTLARLAASRRPWRLCKAWRVVVDAFRLLRQVTTFFFAINISDY